MTVPIDGVRYWFDESASAFVAPGRPSLSLSRPSGPEYVAVESLFQAGDMRADGTFDLSAVLNRCPAGKIVTFPEGEFVVNNFRDDDQVFQAGILVPKHVRGIVGSGKGTLGGSTGTIFSMRPGSSTRGGGAVDRNGKLYVPVQDDVTPCQLNLVKQLDQQYPGVLKNFQVRGTDQGHIFSAMQVYNTIGANVFEDILITGWEGNAGAPPGETIGLSINGRGAHTATRVEVDGRRAVGGPVYGAAGLTYQNNIGGTFVDCYSHHCRAGNFLGFQSFDGKMIRCVIDAASASTYGIGNGSMNFERCAGWEMIDCTIIGRAGKVHITHSNDNYTLTQGGVTRNTAAMKGSLKITNITNNATQGNPRLYVQSWTPYWTGNIMTYPDCAPLVVAADGVTHVPYTWVLDQHRIIT